MESRKASGVITGFNMRKRKNCNILHCNLYICLFFFFLLFIFFSFKASAQEDLGDGWLRFGLGGTSFGPLHGASSVLEAGDGIYRSPYDPGRALDRDPATAWVEGVPGPGLGESYWLGLDYFPEALGFINGYAKNRDLFEKNFRVRSFNVQVFAGVNLSMFAGQWEDYYDARPVTEVRTVELKDSMEPQRVTLPFCAIELSGIMEEFRSSEKLRSLNFPQARELELEEFSEVQKNFLYIIRLEISGTYPGSKWEDTCIAELWPDYGPASDALLSKDGKQLSIVDSGGRVIPVFYDFDYVLTLLEISRDKQWALVIKEPAYPGSGRVSSEYGIIHLPTGRELTADILGPDNTGLLPYSFSFENGLTYVEFENLETGEEGRTACLFY